MRPRLTKIIWQSDIGERYSSRYMSHIQLKSSLRAGRSVGWKPIYLVHAYPTERTLQRLNTHWQREFCR